MQSKILITLGDPNGIGSEITFKALQNIHSNMRQNIELIGLEYFKEKYMQTFPEIIFHSIPETYIPEYGFISPKAGKIALNSLDKAIELLKHHTQYRILITGPISKEAVVLAGNQSFRGHTNYLGDAFGCNTEMIFWSPDWSVILATIHLPLKDIFPYLTIDRMRTVIKEAVKFHQRFYSKGKIGICGLNPHAGENGLIGIEEKTILEPIIQEFQQQGYDIRGPLPPDTIFHAAKQGIYTMIVSLYHDQGLIPFKLLNFFTGVNVTTGLPFLRVSPDHGTAFDIAGKNQADPSGMINTINFIQKFN
ncbi:MAG: PdxA family dehydrogenase [Brevinemataceae bacterium]